jgi:S1-C subfamily serine protease
MRFVCILCVWLLLAATTELALARDEAWLGVASTAGPAIKCDFKSKKCIHEPTEAKVVRIDQAGPAAAAGIKVGDIILSLGDQPIRDGKDLIDAVRMKQPGSTVRLRVRGEAGDRELNLVLGKRPKG